MIPICLVTGFLGTGKTTLLKRIVAANRDRRLVYLINEFSVHDVDGAIVSAENPNVVSIPGGSIFCRCLVSEFIGQLKRTAHERGAVEGLVIEASGMANPKVIEEMLTETGLADIYRLAAVVSVVDPNSFLKLRHTLPNILAQIEAADVILVNKTDCNSDADNAEAIATIMEINPSADVRVTVGCETELEIFGEHTPRGMRGDYAKCRDPNFATFVTDHAYDPEELAQMIQAHSDVVYRVKGRLGGEFFDYSTAGVTRGPLAAEPRETRLAWIVKGGTEQDLLAELAELD